MRQQGRKLTYYFKLVPSWSCNSRHSLLPWDLGHAHFCWVHHPFIGPTIALNQLEGCRFGHWRCVGARSLVIECLSNISVLCPVITLSDVIVMDSCFITRFHVISSISIIIIGSVSEKINGGRLKVVKLWFRMCLTSDSVSRDSLFPLPFKFRLPFLGSLDGAFRDALHQEPSTWHGWLLALHAWKITEKQVYAVDPVDAWTGQCESWTATEPVTLADISDESRLDCTRGTLRHQIPTLYHRTIRLTCLRAWSDCGNFWSPDEKRTASWIWIVITLHMWGE